MNNIRADRQEAGVVCFVRQFGSTISNSVTAPETALMVVKLAASISPSPSAALHSSEFAAKAIIAIKVSHMVRIRWE